MSSIHFSELIVLDLIAKLIYNYKSQPGKGNNPYSLPIPLNMEKLKSIHYFKCPNTSIRFSLKFYSGVICLEYHGGMGFTDMV